ncbi:hypothetical protein P3T20_004069 [Paraburkholderia sp. GAS206C]|uniref:endonuclease NucS domain-containing protein n=1 Tax=unclassified Paraburkholderia TaxID=2615204 RepID=UPI003D1EAEBE
MSTAIRPPIWELLKDAVQHLGGECTYAAIKQHLWAQYPDLNPATITCQLISCSVNHASRIHYHDNKEPRLSVGETDFLYNTGRGKVVWYESDKHGMWEIVRASDGTLSVQQSQAGDYGIDVGTDIVELADDAYGAFALEAHLRDYLAKNLPTMPGQNAPLKLYTSEGRDGVEYQTDDVGPIDILAVAPNGDFYVLELKLGRGPDAALGQILRYMGWVQEHLAQGKPVYGVIVASEISKKLKYATTQTPNVRLMEYQLAVTLKPVSLHT